MPIKHFHWSEMLGGLFCVLTVSVITQPTSVLLVLVAFVAGQVVIRTIRNSRK